MDADGFTVVSKKKTAKKKSIKPLTNYLETTEDNFETCIRKIQQARKDVEASDGFQSLQDNLDKIKRSIQKYQENNCQVCSVVCYGLGKISSSRIARYQTALLLCIQNHFNADVQVFDPLFSAHDEEVLKSLNFKILSVNEEGKRNVTEATLFYMPHCGKELYNNLLWANWNVNSLPFCFIIGNSFHSIVQNVPTRVIKQYYKFIERAEGLFEEYPLKFLVEHDDVFNDMSIHVVNRETIASKNEKIFEEFCEPDYEGCDVEIIRTEILEKNIN